VFKEVAIGDSFLKLVLPDLSVASHVTDERIDVDHGMNAILFPFTAGLLPLWIDLLVELPVPEKSRSFDELLRANPILHPNSDHRDAFRLQKVILGIDFLLATLKRDNGTIHDPLGKRLHSANPLRSDLG